MITLQIYLTAYEGKEKELENAYLNFFRPAIKKQEGYKNIVMLKDDSQMRTYELNLFFETEALRQKWVASDDHQAAWPKIAACCSNASWYLFTVIE
jgi:heme-degrading monooxygenase HmoA